MADEGTTYAWVHSDWTHKLWMLLRAGSFLVLAGNAMPQSSAFFFDYILVQAFAVTMVRVFFPHPGIFIALFRICGCCSAPAHPIGP